MENSPTFFNHNRPPPSSAVGFNLNIHNHHHQEEFINTGEVTTTLPLPIEHMFEKPLTPSDVGKLNRLVIPKQHAEKYFPLVGATDLPKGSVLTFEDESRKLWRFRYSYWNSSQSYVLTKGWSRYVKEKRLDAGDFVLFQRHMWDCDRMFIGWRRRDAAVFAQDRMTAQPLGGCGDGAQVSEWSTRVFYDAQSNYPSQPLPLALPYQPDYLHAGEIYENVNTYQRGVVATRRLRLFGVNLECPDDSELSTPNGPRQDGQSDHAPL